MKTVYNKKILIIASLICILVFITYQIYKIENKRLAEFHEKQKKITEFPPSDSELNYTNEKVTEKIETILPTYEILEISTNNETKCVVSVRIEGKLNEDELSLLALDVKKEANPLSDRLHIFFLLPEMLLGNGAWVRVDFNPNMNIIYLGQTKQTENNIKNGVVGIKNYIGLWYDNYNREEILTRIRTDKTNGLVIEHISPTNTKPSPYAKKLDKVRQNGKTVFKVTDNEHREYYILETNYDLSIYDDHGYIQTLKNLAFNGFKN